MVKNEPMPAIPADPNDPDDFDVTGEALQIALREREERRRKGGRPRGSSKEQVTLRLDAEILAKFRAGGPGWQSRINEALRRSV